MSNLIILDRHNVHSSILDFCSDNEEDILDDNIILKMQKKGYMFSLIPPTILKRILASLRIYKTQGTHEESNIISMSTFNICPMCKQIQEQEEIDYKVETSDSE